MKTVKGTECSGQHDHNGFSDERKWNVYQWDGRRYTVCAHQCEHGAYCGNLIDVTDRPAQICCGEH